jgi:uncharacterized membrane protein YczE
MRVQPWKPTWQPVVALIGMSRHSALSALRTVSKKTPHSFAVQLASLIVGSALIGVAVALLVEARLGLAPYDVLASGLSRRGVLSLGQASWLIAAGFTLVAIMLGRRPSAWGIAYVFLNGLAIDAASEILREPSSMLLRIAFVPAGILAMAAGINVVLHSGTTGGPFDLLVAAGEDRGISALKVRYILDIGVLLSGVAIGGAFGPATVVYGALMGFTIVSGSQALADHRRGRKIRAADEAREPRRVRMKQGRRIAYQSSASTDCERPVVAKIRRPIMQIVSSTNNTTQRRTAAKHPPYDEEPDHDDDHEYPPVYDIHNDPTPTA